jgi:hypothetical protein
MNSELFERLLYEEENTTLDFKREQYRFIKATDDEKSELLKDILGFANAWRRTEAYILIGVEDVRGGRGEVIGIPATDHLDDHSLQQFVNNLTNQPVRFHYEAFGVEGKQVGIISIEQQTRPIYLKRDYGKLMKERVFVRRGSSTDPNKPASLEEIAQMRVGSDQLAAELLVEFAHLERDDSFGTTVSWDVEFCNMPAVDTIPDLEAPRPRTTIYGLDLSALRYDPMNRVNDDFFRELAHFEFIRRLFRPVRLVVQNIGKVPANKVRAEITIPTNTGVTAMPASKIPERPKQRESLLISSALSGVNAAIRQSPGEVDIIENDERFRVEIDCGDLQPGRRIWSDVFYIGKVASGNLALRGVIFADNLPQPKDFELTVAVTVKETTMAVYELCSLSNKQDG